jgi:hypothetical protein
VTVHRAFLAAALWGATTASAVCQVQESRPRGGAGAGMGVAYMSRTEIVDLVNMTPGALERISDFKAGAEFFGYLTVPLSSSWVLKGDYTFMIASYNLEASSGTAQYTLTTHAPSILLQYVLTDRGLYNFKIGAGGGPRFFAFSEKYLYIDDTFTAAGAGIVLELEGNTALGEDLFVHLAAFARWESGGDLKNELGKPPGSSSTGSHAGAGGFGVGVRLGLSYYFF